MVNFHRRTGAMCGLLGLCLFLALLGSSPSVCAQRQPLSEQEKIDHIIKHVYASDVTFIRNGRAHGAKEASAHLRMKYEKAGHRITTAQMFIDHIASQSSMTGKPYVIQLPDGKRVQSRKWLTEYLHTLDSIEE